MNELDLIFKIIDIITNIFMIVGVVVATFQLRMTRKSFLADHERRKKQSTIEFCHEILEILSPLRSRIKNTFGEDHINIGDPRYNDGTLQSIITNYLNTMERLAVGINLKVYDLHTFRRISGRSTINMFNKLKGVIDHKRKKANRTDMYGDFEKLVHDLNGEYYEENKTQHEDKATIQHS